MTLDYTGHNKQHDVSESYISVIVRVKYQVAFGPLPKSPSERLLKELKGLGAQERPVESGPFSSAEPL